MSFEGVDTLDLYDQLAQLMRARGVKQASITYEALLISRLEKEIAYRHTMGRWIEARKAWEEA